MKILFFRRKIKVNTIKINFKSRNQTKIYRSGASAV